MSDYSQCNDYFTPNEEEYLLTVDEARDIFDNSIEELSRVSTNYKS